MLEMFRSCKVVSVSRAQRTAKAAMIDMGDDAPKPVQMLANLGAGGGRIANMMRDLRRKMPDCPLLDPIEVLLPLNIAKERVIRRVAIIPPHRAFAALYEAPSPEHRNM